MKAFVVVPTYNEADNIANFVTELFKLNLPDLNVLIVDDESPDGTGKTQQRIQKKTNLKPPANSFFPQFVVVA
jgi:dolichol-phosphate mannosyltransferase